MPADPTSPAIAVHRLRKYNPARMTDAEIELTFVARKDLLERILQDLAGERADSRPQQHLIIGQRGMGKTTLLLRLAAALRSAEYRQRFVPLVFAEEQYSVDRLSKFWLNCLDSLADCCELEGNTAAADRIDGVVQRLDRSTSTTAAGDADAARATLRALLDQSAQLQRRPVLLVDNLQIVFERTSHQQHELRDALTQPGAPIIVAASPQLPSDLQDYGAAFYDQFKTHYLRALTVDDMRHILVSLAEMTHRDDVSRHVLGHPGRLRTIHQLTGGNPRTTVLLFHLYAEDCSPSVGDDLEKLLDDVTPLYKARFEEVSEQQQVVVSQIAEHWDPIDSRTLCERTALSAGQVSSQLDRLKRLGVVEEVELYGKKRSGYQLAERFYNVWFLMRHASRRQRRQVTFLTRFLETLYEAPDRERIARRMLGERPLSRGGLSLSLAMAESLHDSPLKFDLQRNAQLAALYQRRQDARARVEELLDLSQIPPLAIAFDELRHRLTTLLGAELAERTLGDREFFVTGKRAPLAARESLTDEERNALAEELTLNRETDLARYEPAAVDWFRDRLVSGQLCDATAVGDWERAVAAGESVAKVQYLVDAIPESVSAQLPEACRQSMVDRLRPTANGTEWHWFSFGYDLHVKLQHYAEAEAAYRQAIALDPKYAIPWYNLGNLLQYHLGRYAEAEAAYRQAIALDPKNVRPWNNLGSLLQVHLGRYVEAEEAYRQAIAIDPNNARPWNGLGILLQDHLGRYVEAEAAYRQAIAIDPQDAGPWNNLGNLLQHQLGRYAEAEAAYRQAIAIDPQDAGIWRNQGNLLGNHLGRYAEAEEAYRQAITLDPQDAGHWNGLGNLYADYLGKFDLADAAFAEAMKSPEEAEVARRNRVFLLRDFLGQRPQALALYESAPLDVPIDCDKLHAALFAAYERNWGIAATHLRAALELIDGRLPLETTDDWVRTAAVLLHLGYGAEWLTLLREQGEDQRLRPYYEAIHAQHLGSRDALKNIAVEVRESAAWFYDQIALRRSKLPTPS